LKNKIIYAGVNDYYIYCWDFNKGTFIGKVKGNNTSVNSMTFDKNFLITSGSNGIIDIWNMNNIENENNLLTLIISLKDPDLNMKESVRIHDILMLNNVGILVSCNNLNKINFWKYEKEELLFSISKEQETMCLAVVESYGKLLLGTKEKMIVEVDLAEQLNNINYPHNYEKYPFLKNEINYMENVKDKGIDNFKIMKILTNKNDFFK
jgi:WD40 repeat protein